MNFVIVSHTRFNDKGDPVHGTASELAPLLEKKRKSYIYIQHSLFAGVATRVVVYFEGKKTAKKVGLKYLPFPLRILQEHLITFFILSKYKTSSSVYIGIDPLNAWLGILLKKIGKTKKVIFYTADYAKNRYSNSLMNNIYHWFDKFSIKNADQVWNVSSRITSERIVQGVPKEKNFLIPNAPMLPDRQKQNISFEKHTLVIVTHITKAIDFESLLFAVDSLKKKYKDIKLLIVGNGDYANELKEKVKSMSLVKHVIFTGSKSHEEVMKIISKSGIGLAIYTDDFPWTKYGDSMKAREYLVYGLPVIINDIPSTADDIRKAKAGIVVKSSKKIKNAIEYLFSNNKEYAIMRKNAYSLAKESDFSRVVEYTNILQS